MKTLAEVFAPDPCDMGALLRAAVDAYRVQHGVTQAEVARRAGVLPESLCRAMGRPDAAPALVRKVCAVLGLRVALVPARAP